MASGQTTSRDAFITLEDAGATARTVSGDVNTSTLSRSSETPENSGYGTRTRKRIADGIFDWSIAGTCFFNDTANTGIETLMAALLGAQTVIVWGPAGSASGNISYTGSGIVQDYNIDAPVDGVTALSFTVVASAGSLTRGTF